MRRLARVLRNANDVSPYPYTLVLLLLSLHALLPLPLPSLTRPPPHTCYGASLSVILSHRMNAEGVPCVIGVTARVGKTVEGTLDLMAPDLLSSSDSVLLIGAGCRVSGAGCRVPGVGCRVSGVGCRVFGRVLLMGAGVGWNTTTRVHIRLELGTL